MAETQTTSGSTRWGWLAKSAGLALVYFAIGELTLFLAIPPSYASTLWPPAGIALAGVLLFGNRVWPGVFVGSFLIVSTAPSLTGTDPLVAAIVLPTAISIGATLQAALGAFLVRRFVGFPSNFERLRRVVGTMILGGPLACLTNATVASATLLLAGSIEKADLARSWSTWFLGDSIGVLLVVPLASAWGAELHRASRRTKIFVSVPVLAAVVMTLLGYLGVREEALRRVQSEFERRAVVMALSLEQAVQSKLEVVRSVVSLFEASEVVDRAEFRAFVEPAFARHREFRALGWAVPVSLDRRATVEEAERQGAFPEFQITERGADGKMARARDRDEYTVVVYVDPYEGNEEALGFDLASDPSRARALREARETGRTIATAPIKLVQETGQDKGFLVLAPIYEKGLPRDTPDARRRNLHSYVSGVFSGGRLVKGAMKAFQGEGIDYRIVDTTDPGDRHLLYDGGASGDQAAALPAELAWSTDLEVAGRRWTVLFRPTSRYASAAPDSWVGVVLTGGLFFTSLLGAFLLVVAGRASATERSNEELRGVIEERLQAEAALKKSEEYFRAVFENAAVGVSIVDNNGRFVLSNAALQRTLGYSGEELAAKRFVEVTHPEDIAADLDQYEELMAGKGPHYELEKRYITKSGEVVWGHLAVSVVRDPEGKPLFGVGINQDITERKVVEQALLYTQFTVDHAGDGIFWVGDDGRLVYVNEAACRMTGYPREALLAMTVFDIDPNYSRGTWPEFWRRVQSAGSTVISSLMRRKDGTVFPTEIVINYLEVDGVGRCSASARDSTERKKAEADRIELETKVQETQKLESLGVLAGGIAHDFNNLLVGVLGNADLALTHLPLASPVRDAVRDIETSAQRAADLANQLLAYSGKGKFVVEPIDLSDLVDETAHLVKVSVSKKVEVNYDLASNLPAIEADATQVRQVVLNLITNASEAIGDSVGVLSITTGLMECGADYLAGLSAEEELPAGAYAFVEVADTGGGMDEETRKRIFEPFFTTKFTGRGLGLAAVLGIVRGHKGAIQVSSEPGGGATIKVLFPVSERGVPKPQRQPAGEPEWTGAGTVLLVDDEEMVRLVGTRMLTVLGFEVITAADGVEALEVYRERSADIAVVLLDLAMPRMGGEETCTEIRRIKADARVLLCSGYDEQETTSRFSGEGIVGFIQKPYRLDALRDKIRATLEC